MSKYKMTKYVNEDTFDKMIGYGNNFNWDKIEDEELVLELEKEEGQYKIDWFDGSRKYYLDYSNTPFIKYNDIKVGGNHFYWPTEERALEIHRKYEDRIRRSMYGQIKVKIIVEVI